MYDIIYNFIRYTLIGETTLESADYVANILTAVSIVFMFVMLIKIVVWAFGLFKVRHTRF